VLVIVCQSHFPLCPVVREQIRQLLQVGITELSASPYVNPVSARSCAFVFRLKRLIVLPYGTEKELSLCQNHCGTYHPPFCRFHWRKNKAVTPPVSLIRFYISTHAAQFVVRPYDSTTTALGEDTCQYAVSYWLPGGFLELLPRTPATFRHYWEGSLQLVLP
jgi:hypothetical protein